MSSTEFSEWMIYAELEPFGSLRDDQRSGVIAATLANVNAGKSSKTYTYEDFLYTKLTKRVQTVDEQLRIVEILNTAFGGDDLRTTSAA